jgi:hypothetical protein
LDKQEGECMGVHKEVIKLSIKNEIFEQFKQQKAQEGTLLAPKWLYEELLPTLSKKEMKALEEILSEMIHDGIIEHVQGKQPSYRLTKKGEQLL